MYPKIIKTLTPQMINYSKLTANFEPYLMFFNPPNYVSNSCNTDNYGFRHTYKRNEIVDYKMFSEYSGGKSIICGGSAAFGVGATNDRKTLTSCLNNKGDKLWFNYCGRAFNSTQELILFSLFQQDNIKDVVLFGGVNNLITYYQSNNYSSIYGSFFRESLYKEVYDVVNKKRMSRKRRLYNAISSFITENKKTDRDQAVKSFSDLLCVTERDLKVWFLFKKALGFRLLYVLQPLATWINKKLSPEEKKLFEALDVYPVNNWRFIEKDIKDSYSKYKEGVELLCKNYNIEFYDFNNDHFREAEWYFIDRIHLTDLGYEKCSKILMEEIL